MTANTLPLARYLRVIPTAYYSSVPGIEATIQWLCSHGYPPLPIVPQQCAYTYPRVVMGKEGQGSACPVNQRLEPIGMFSGKNPSYFQGQRPRLLRHRVFTERLPTTDELKRWFEQPQVGVATLGGWQQTVWVDLDAKCFPSRAACEQVGNEWLDFIPALRQGFVERTQSGGWRLGVRCEQLPTFSKVAFSPGGSLLGEVLGQGVPAVLAPTIGVKGVYESLHRGAPITLESLASISLYPAGGRRKATRPTYTPTCVKLGSGAGTAVSLQPLFSQRVQQLWQSAGSAPLGQRSDVFIKVARESFGWERWLTEHGYRPSETASDLCYALASRLDLEVDRVERMLGSASEGRAILDSYPSRHFYGGDEACQQRVQYILKRE